MMTIYEKFMNLSSTANPSSQRGEGGGHPGTVDPSTVEPHTVYRQTTGLIHTVTTDKCVDITGNETAGGSKATKKKDASKRMIIRHRLTSTAGLCIKL